METKLLEINLDPKKARQDFDKYKDHPLQPQGYNIFIQDPPKNPENRHILDPKGMLMKVIVGDDEPLEWPEENLGKSWDWAKSDVNIWAELEGKLYFLTISTVNHELSRLSEIGKYFDNLLKNNVNIYEDPKFSAFLPTSMSYRDMYIKEIKNIKNRMKDLKVGYIKTNPKEPDNVIDVCLPEDCISNEILEKWHPIFSEFIASGLEELIFEESKQG